MSANYDTPGVPNFDFSSAAFEAIAFEMREKDIAVRDQAVDVEELWVIDEVKRGGMGEVLLCHKKDRPDVSVALKTFRHEYLDSVESQRLFYREAIVWAALTGIPFILPLHGVHTYDRRPYIAMPRMYPNSNGATTLADCIATRTINNHDVISYLNQIAAGLTMAIEHLPGLVHGDLKPNNILISNRFNMIYVSDFGVARVGAAAARTNVKVRGARSYAAPEVAESLQFSTAAADVYSFGKIAIELASASPDSANLNAVLDLARYCMEPNPSDRPASIRDVYVELFRIATEFGISAPSTAKADEDPLLAVNQQIQATRISYQLAIDLGQSDFVIQSIEQIPRDERIAQTWVTLGNALSTDGKDEEALAMFAQARAAKSGYWWVRRSVEPGTPLRNTLGEEVADKVVAMCDRMIDGLPDIIDNAEALSYKHLQRYDEAEEVFSRLCRRHPELSMFAINRAGSLIAAGNTSKAVHILLDVTRRDISNARAWSQLGIAYDADGQFKMALSCFRRAISIEPLNDVNFVHAARIAMDDLRDLGLALDYLRRALRTGTISQEAMLRFIWAAVTMNDQAALDELKELVEDQYPVEVVNELIGSARASMSRRNRSDREPQGEEVLQEPRAETIDNAETPTPTSLRLIQLDDRHSIWLTDIECGIYSIDIYATSLGSTLMHIITQYLARCVVEQGGAILRSEPFRVEMCSECRVFVITNRPVGVSRERCAVCYVAGAEITPDGSNAEEVLDLVREILGRPQSSLPAGLEFCGVILARLDDRSQLERLGFEFHGTKFVELDAGSPSCVRTYCLRQWHARRPMPPNSEFFVASAILQAPQDMQYRGPLVSEIENSILRIRRIQDDLDTQSIHLEIDLLRTLQKLEEGDLSGWEARAPAGSTFLGTHWIEAVQLTMDASLFEVALRCAEKAVEANGDSAAAWAHLGAANVYMQNWDRAKPALDQAILLDRTFGMPYLYLCHYYDHIGNDDAVSHYFRLARAYGYL